MLVQLYHGGKDLNIHAGYETKGKDRAQMGVGLYTTTSIDVARRYSAGSRCTYIIEADLDPAHEINKIKLSADEFDAMMYEISLVTSKALIKRSIEYFKANWLNQINADSFDISIIVNYFVNEGVVHKIAKTLNHQCVMYGVQYERTTFSGYPCYIIYDYRCIKSVRKFLTNVDPWVDFEDMDYK